MVTVALVPELLEIWDWDENEKSHLSPELISCGSHRSAYWICPIHHCTYFQIIRNRYHKQIGCVMCKKEKAEAIPRERYIMGKTVLAESNPALVQEWISADNPKYTPNTVLSGSGAKVLWKCKKCSGEYYATVANRAINGSGCPYCAGQKVLAGYNDLQTVNPTLASEWSSKNPITPDQVTAKSNVKVFWMCRLGHEDYYSSIKQRSNGQGCPECAKESHTSFPEQALFFYLRQLFPDAINRAKIGKMEIDVYLPSINKGIEYNGIFYHKDKRSHDLKKKKALLAEGITLLTIQEYDTDFASSEADFYIHENASYNSLDALIWTVLDNLAPGSQLSVSCERDSLLIREMYINSIKENSIAEKRPDLLNEWDYERNGKIRPEFVAIGSNTKYYWQCPHCGYSYLASAKSRARGRGCSICSGKTIKPGLNDLLSKYPDIAAEWDYEKNIDMTPDRIAASSSKKVWWKCKNGHSWYEYVNNRTKQKSGCPYCSGKKVSPGVNDLLTKKPELAANWDCENNIIDPSTIHYNNQTLVINWRCRKCGFTWRTKISNYHKCPNCTKLHRQINVYNNQDYSLYGQFEDAKQLCEHLGLDYHKQHGNISMVCSRKQKTLLGKFILRHGDDDEFSSIAK